MTALFIYWEWIPQGTPPVDIESLMEHKIRKETRSWGIYKGKNRIGTTTSTINPFATGMIRYSSEYELTFQGQEFKGSLQIDIGGFEKRRVIEKLRATFDMQNLGIKDGKVIGTVADGKLNLKIQFMFNEEMQSLNYSIDNFDNHKMIQMMFTPLITKRRLNIGDEWTSQNMSLESMTKGGADSYTAQHHKVTDSYGYLWEGKEIDIFVVRTTDDTGKLVSIAKISRDGEVLEQAMHGLLNVVLKLEKLEIDGK